MNPIDLQPTNTTPAITLKDNLLSIRGRSIPLSEAKFYDPYIEWAKEVTSESLTVEIKLEFMNSSSIKKLLLLLRNLDANKNVVLLNIDWFYEVGDDELKEHGLVLGKLLKRATLRIIKYNEL